MLEECRWVFNQTLAYRKDAWEQRQESVSLYATNALLPKWKQERSSLTMVYSQVLQDVQERVDLAFKAFFRRVKAGQNPGYPRFKGKGRYDSLTYPQFGFSLEDKLVKVAKIGLLKATVHRPLEGKVKMLTLRRHNTGKWYACFSCEVEPKPLPVSDKAVGIDVGLESFATLSTGDKIANPRFFKTDDKALAKAQRKLSKMNKGTIERRKAKKVVTRIHERISNRRHNFIHQEARKIVNRFGIICIEKLNIKDMMSSQTKVFGHKLNKSIADVAWSQFAQQLFFKAEDAGRKVIAIEPRGTSQMCSQCGTIVKKDLSVRWHECSVCDIRLHRDFNASLNILALGLHGMGKIPRSPRL
ncbi:MAG: hypothetical protein DDT32_01890 [Syntrophomonadaceae bacterium]|nr:hypothetical protein [Bacillota bacterium]